MKVSIVGTGMVGSSISYRLLASGLASDIALYDVNTDRASGEAMDMLHAMAVEPATRIMSGDVSVLANSDIVVITAGLARKDGETRLDLINKNLIIFRDMIPTLVQQAPDAIYVVISNPADVMTYATIQYGNLDPKKVIGTGTMLDTMRFRAILATYFGTTPSDVNAYIVGEHGDSQVACFSAAMIGGLPLATYAQQRGLERNDEIMTRLATETKTCGALIIKRKMATYYGIASGTVRVIQAIARDEQKILPLCTLQNTANGRLCTNLPTIIGRTGVIQVLDLPMNVTEKAGFDESNKVLAEYVKVI